MGEIEDIRGAMEISRYLYWTNHGDEKRRSISNTGWPQTVKEEAVHARQIFKLWNNTEIFQTDEDAVEILTYSKSF